MQLTRREVVLLALAAATPLARAEAYPSKQIQFIIPYPPGGASDIIARLLAEKMQEVLGQAVVIQNRPGANGNIALELVAKAPHDGYTILMGNVGPNAVNAALYPPSVLKFDAIKSFQPVIQTGNVPMVLVAGVDQKLKNVGDLVQYAKSQKQQVIFATGGNGSATHMASALIEMLAHVKFEHVQYKGDPLTLTDIAGGHVGIGMVTLPALKSFLTNPKIRLLGVTTKLRTPILPDVPTFAESGIPGYDASSWGGVFTPAGVSPEIVTTLNKTIAAILKDKTIEPKLADLGVDIVANSSAEFTSFMAGEVKKWQVVVKQTGITIE